MLLKLALPLMAALCFAEHELLALGSGKGTFSYDVNHSVVCNDVDLSKICNSNHTPPYDLTQYNDGQLACSPVKLSPMQVGVNTIVAMNDTELQNNLEKYCGKRVNITIDGNQLPGNFFIGDGCRDCIDMSGLALSFSALESVDPLICYHGYKEISWKIVNDSVYSFSTSDDGNQRGLVGASTSRFLAPINATWSNYTTPLSTDTITPTSISLTTISTAASEQSNTAGVVPSNVAASFTCTKANATKFKISDKCKPCELSEPACLRCDCNSMGVLYADLKQRLTNKNGSLEIVPK